MGSHMIIGFSGTKGSGKDTAAKALIQDGFRKIAFADPLKNMLRTYLRTNGVLPDIIEDMIEGPFKETPSQYLCGKSPRHAMQTLGTEWGRELIGSNIWLDTFARSCLQFPNVVCTDVRFLNEGELIKKLGGIIIRIRPVLPTSSDTHISEIEMETIRCDALITNEFDGVEAFQKKVREVVYLIRTAGL